MGEVGGGGAMMEALEVDPCDVETSVCPADYGFCDVRYERALQKLFE